MNRIILFATITLFLTASIGCRKAPKTAEIMLTCKPLGTQSVDVSSLRAELHTTATYESLKYYFEVKGSATTSSGTMKEIVPGRYFLVVWKDNDNSNDFSKNDFFGFYPQPLNLVAGDQIPITVEMYVVE
jgi:hypothetical protein